jgi:nitroreductase
MDALELLLGRESALKLESPGPSEAELEVMFRSAVRAPDHGRLRPWQFVVVPEDRREAFGGLLAESMARRMPHASAEELARERGKAMRAPVIVVAAAKLAKGHKIPEIEQLLSAGAAVEHIILAANAQGYGAMWKTGAPAYDAAVKAALGIAADSEIVGFLYLGTQVGAGAQVPRPAAGDFVSVWQG